MGYCGADFMPGKQVSVPTQGAVHIFAISAPVITLTTPGAFSAAAVSMRTMRAWACGLRTKAACSMRGSEMSSVYVPRPATAARAATRESVRPT